MQPSPLPSASDRLFLHSGAAVSLRSQHGAWVAYALGYRLAADALIDRLLSNAAPIEVAYPALFCYRQYLELELKNIAALAILVGAKIAEKGEDEVAWSPKATSESMFKRSQHDLAPLLAYAEAICRKVLPAQSDAFVGLAACVREFSTHDPSSFAFRYPTGKALHSFTLENLTTVDFQHFKNTAAKMTLLLTEIRRFADRWVQSFDDTDDEPYCYDRAELRRFGIFTPESVDEELEDED